MAEFEFMNQFHTLMDNLWDTDDTIIPALWDSKKWLDPTIKDSFKFIPNLDYFPTNHRTIPNFFLGSSQQLLEVKIHYISDGS